MPIGERHSRIEHRLTAEEIGAVGARPTTIPGSRLDLSAHPTDFKAWNESLHPRATDGRFGEGAGKKPTLQHTTEINYVAAGGKHGSLKFKLSQAATALHNDPRWIWETDDLLSAADGHRAAGFSDTDNAMKPNAADKINKLFKEFGLHGTAKPILNKNGKSEGIVVIRNSNLKDKDVNVFIAAVRAYVGDVGKMTSNTDRVLGKWLGFPKQGTEHIIRRDY